MEIDLIRLQYQQKQKTLLGESKIQKIRKVKIYTYTLDLYLGYKNTETESKKQVNL